MNACAHLTFHAEVAVNRLEDIGAFSADVQIACLDCGEHFAFIGMEPGLSGDGPRVSISQLEAHLPIRPESARLPPARRYGFSVTEVPGPGKGRPA